MTVAVCTNRLDDLEARWEPNIAAAGSNGFLALFDTPGTARGRALAARIEAAGGEVVWHGDERGLSAARNSVMAARPDDWVLFVDDDTLLGCEAIEQARTAFAAGAHVVGARLIPPPGSRAWWPWFFGEGQMHLVGWHAPESPVKTWGAFMGIDVAFAREHALLFEARLGRTGRRLESGDDTSFVAAMKRAGACEVVVDAPVVHDVDARRLSVRYLARRAYWQGRSEVRRRQSLTGLSKEWSRHRAGRRAVPAILFVGAYLAGVLREWPRPVADGAGTTS